VRGKTSAKFIQQPIADFSRLKKRLNLPSITSRPPCPPRIYKKLYNYLSSALPESTTAHEPTTPRKPTASAPASARNTPSKTPLSARKTPRRVESNGEAPEWVMPTIRALAKTFDYTSLIPHVYTGVESIYPLLSRMSAAAAETPSKRLKRTTASSSGDVSDTRVLSLIVVVFLLVYSRMRDIDVSIQQYNEWLAKAIKAVMQLPAAKEVTDEEMQVKIDETMKMAKEEGWLQMQWFDSVRPQADGEEMEGVEMSGNTAAKAKGMGLRSGGSDYIGLGTMMQDATDYLGERQQEDYMRWKVQILAKVQELETSV
jgi:origin recognition complex subunit 6